MALQLATGRAVVWVEAVSGKTIGCAVTLDSLEPRHFILL